MTNAITPIFNSENGEVQISGHQLHMFLEVQTPYWKWFPRMCEYGFTEGIDFNTDKNVLVQNEGGREVRREITDHLMTLSMDMELFTIKETTINHADGHTSISKTPKVTGKGQVYFVNKFAVGA